jgi:anti-sigma B factor antagonist
MEVTIKGAERANDWSIVSVKGRLDTLTAPDLEKQVIAWIGEGHRMLLLDLTGVEFLSSAGIRAILVAAKKTKEQKGTMAVAGLQGIAQEAFKLSGCSTIISTYASVDSALKGLNPHSN